MSSGKDSKNAFSSMEERFGRVCLVFVTGPAAAGEAIQWQTSFCGCHEQGEIR